MTKYRIDMQKCPSCGKENDAISSVDEGTTSEPGDIIICLYCGHVMAIAGDGKTFRKLTNREMCDIAGNGQILALQRARAKVMKKHEQ